MPEFKRLYLDTTVLRESQWPRVSVRLANVLELTRNFGIAVFLPEPVEIEREGQWRRDISSEIDRYNSAAGNLDKALRDISGDSPPKTTLQIEKAMNDYRSAADAAMDRCGIRTIPTTAMPVRDLLSLAVQREPPFRESGKNVVGFQDAVILFSVLDDLRSAAEIGALLSADTVFADVARLAREYGVTLRHFVCLDDYRDAFAQEIKPELSRWWEEDRRQAKRALEDKKSDIEQFVLSACKPESLSRNEKVVAVEEAEMVEIIKVETPLPELPNFPPPYTRPTDIEVLIACSVKFKFIVLATEGFFAYLATSFWSDRYPDQPPPPLVEESPARRRIWRTVDLAATAIFAGQGYRISDLRLVGIQGSFPLWD